MSWADYERLSWHDPNCGFGLDLSAMAVSPERLDELDGPMAAALAEMQALEGGAIANPDEKRMVGHYWLRAAGMAPTNDIAAAIEKARAAVVAAAAKVSATSPVVCLACAHWAKFPDAVGKAIGEKELGACRLTRYIYS